MNIILDHNDHQCPRISAECRISRRAAVFFNTIVTLFGSITTKTRICAAEMAVRYAAEKYIRDAGP